MNKIKSTILFFPALLILSIGCLTGCGPSVQADQQAFIDPGTEAVSNASETAQVLRSDTVSMPLTKTEDSGGTAQDTDMKINPGIVHSDGKPLQPETQPNVDIIPDDALDPGTPGEVTENQKRPVSYTVEKVDVSKNAPPDAAVDEKASESSHSYVRVTLKVKNMDPGKVFEFVPSQREIRFASASEPTQPVKNIESGITPVKGYYPAEAGQEAFFILDYLIPDHLLDQMYYQLGGRYGYTDRCDMRFEFSDIIYLKIV